MVDQDKIEDEFGKQEREVSRAVKQAAKTRKN